MIVLWATLRRELLGLWVTPLAWVLLTAFLVVQGLSFYLVLLHTGAALAFGPGADPVQAWFGQTAFLVVSLLLICPTLTMRSFAEERRSGTIEPLLTAPVGAVGLVLGKYLAVLVTYVALWLPTVLYLLVLRHVVALDWGVVAASYLGVVAIGAGYLAVGVLASTLTRSQLVAAMLTMVVTFGSFILGLGEFVFDPGPAWQLSHHVSVHAQMEELSRGVVDSRRLVYDATLVVLPLFLAVRVVASWRWE